MGEGRRGEGRRCSPVSPGSPRGRLRQVQGLAKAVLDADLKMWAVERISNFGNTRRLAGILNLFMNGVEVSNLSPTRSIQSESI